MYDHHLDCWSGLAGDMFLGACLDLGMPEAVLAEMLGALRLPGIGIEMRKARRGGLAGTRFRVLREGRPIEGPDPEEDPGSAESATHQHPHEPGNAHVHSHSHSESHSHAAGSPAREPQAHAEGTRDLAAIRSLIGESGLAAPVKELSLQLFSRLGEAEARAHGVSPEQVHFHEVGAVDSIVDLVGAAAAMQWIGEGRLTCGLVNVGGGTVATAHGQLPVPAPASADLLRGVPIYGSPGGELVTPSGAVLLAELVSEFTTLPAMRVEGVGYGLGKRETPGRPNAVRLSRGQPVSMSSEVMVVECEIDDLPGEGFGFLLERLLEADALDAYFTPVQMKKNRPGTLVTVLCRRGKLQALAGILMTESGSLGCRFHAVERFEAEREQTVVDTPFGPVRVKVAHFAGRSLAAAPEYEDCRRLALERGAPWREVYRAAVTAYAQRSPV